MKRIFTYWHSEVLPDLVRACIQSWRRSNPEYDISIYNQEMFEKEFDIDISSNWYKDIIHQHRADYVRLCLLEKYGGFWVDASTIISDKLDDFLNNETISGYSAITCEEFQILESWFMYAPLGDQFIIDWKKELDKALKMGLDNYKLWIIRYLNDVYNQGKIELILKNKLISWFNMWLPYLTIHACYIKVVIETNRFANMIKGMYGPLNTITNFNWDSTRFTDYISKSGAKHYFILKLTKGIRDNLTKLIDDKTNQIENNSLIDSELLPYYKNILMIRTHNPTQKMVERIKRVYLECPERKFILSINVSIDSFIVEDDTDIFGHDLQNFSSDTQLIEAIPDLLKKRKYSFVQFDDIYHYKNIEGVYNVNPLKTKSKYRKLYRLKQNLIDLIEYFGDSVHIYTEQNIFDRFGKNNLNNIWDMSVAWNYHNECIMLALEQTNGVFIDKINRLWVLEDDLEYTGNINEFFKEYDSVDLDLLEEKSHNTVNDIFLNLCTNTKFKGDILEGSIRCHKAFEHIISMSGRFIDGMARLLDSGYNGHSELTTISYCYHLNMKYVDIDTKHFSKQFNNELDSFDNNNAVKEYVNKLKASGDKLLVHPCKY